MARSRHGAAKLRGKHYPGWAQTKDPRPLDQQSRDGSYTPIERIYTNRDKHHAGMPASAGEYLVLRNLDSLRGLRRSAHNDSRGTDRFATEQQAPDHDPDQFHRFARSQGHNAKMRAQHP